jgi:hypothetical protein
MTSTRKRGRPPTPQTIEKVRIQAMFDNPPDYLPKMTDEERRSVQESLQQSDHIRKKILKKFKHGRTTPDEHAFSMESLGHELLIGYEKQILEQDKFYKARSLNAQKAGALAVKTQASRLSQEVCEKFRDLLSRVEPLGDTTVTQASQLMARLWSRYGLTGDPPTERTLRSWIRSASPFGVHRVGKAS